VGEGEGADLGGHPPQRADLGGLIFSLVVAQRHSEVRNLELRSNKERLGRLIFALLSRVHPGEQLSVLQ
jgi:hypothetical protein